MVLFMKLMVRRIFLSDAVSGAAEDCVSSPLAVPLAAPLPLPLPPPLPFPLPAFLEQAVWSHAVGFVTSAARCSRPRSTCACDSELRSARYAAMSGRDSSTCKVPEAFNSPTSFTVDAGSLTLGAVDPAGAAAAAGASSASASAKALAASTIQTVGSSMTSSCSSRPFSTSNAVDSSSAASGRATAERRSSEVSEPSSFIHLIMSRTLFLTFTVVVVGAMTPCKGLPTKGTRSSQTWAKSA
mmetsp:Transcript_52326/g.162366  ORF Transcript_52326/g.162366 Transcript_52326/m.162366 type:complete len:241 (+) Transcript_52326:464-1186(+)